MGKYFSPSFKREKLKKNAWEVELMRVRYFSAFFDVAEVIFIVKFISFMV